MRIVFLDESTITLNNDIDFLSIKNLGEYISYSNSTEKEIIDRASGVEILISNKAPISRKVIKSLEKLKMVSVIATGYNNVDLAAAGEFKIRICNVAGYATTTVPQHTFSLILNLATKSYLYDRDVHTSQWSKASNFTLLKYPTFELSGKTIGIIGFGNIGKSVARIAESFDMNVLIYDVVPLDAEKYRKVRLNELLKESDVITIHCPLTEETNNLIDGKAISMMKENAIIINTARGGIVDEQALADALNSGKIAGAGFDVLTNEPPKDGNSLLNAKNIILTPHSAWSTREARQRLVDETAENIKVFIGGGRRNVIL
jgi:glycerate dehydrogenase